jgi:hypothetical protein
MHIEAPGDELSRLFIEDAAMTPLGQNAPLASYLAGQIGQLPRVPTCARPTIDAAVAIIDEQILAHREHDMALSFCPPRSPVSWQYFRLSVWQTNKRILADLLKLWDRADDMVKRLPPLASVTYERNIVLGADFNLYPLGEWIKLWIEVISLPKAVKLDLSKSINYNLDYNSHRSYVDNKLKIPGRAPLVPQETIFGPLLELATTVAEFAGVTVPNLPFFAEAKKGKIWYKSLGKSVRKFAFWKQSEDLVAIAWQYAGRLQRGAPSGSLMSLALQTPDEPPW